MYKSYLKIGWRNLVKNKGYSFINIMGLAIGLAVGFLIYQYIQVELSYDRFHANAHRIYRLPISYSGSFSSLRPSATTHPAMGPMLKADLPEVQDFARLVRASLFIPAATVSYTKGDGAPIIFNEERVYLADPSFLTVFSFPLTDGDVKTALSEPKSIVITARIAEKYFGSDDALGKILQLNQQDFKVTGVLANIPVNSHLQFDILLSFSTLGDKWGYDNWAWPEFYNYILLAPGTDPKTVEAKLPGFMKKYLSKIWEEHKFESSTYLQPITDIHLKSDLGLEQDINGSERTVYFLTLLSLFVLVIAWINYVNLSTAKSLERSKEVGLRKVSGATKRQLITQFFFDALLVNVFAILFAGILLTFGIPYFETIVGKDISSVLQTSGTWYSFSFWGIVLAALSTGILIVGIYPALLLSNFNPALVLKGKFYKSRSGIVLRKGLVVFQYVLSIFLIAGTITISRQLNFMQKADLGYDKEQVLVLRSAAINDDSTYSSQIAYFKNKILQLQAVEQVTASGEIPGRAIAGRNTIRKAADDPQNGLITYHFSVDDQTISTFGMSMAAGRDLGENDKFISYSENERELTADGYYVGGGQNKIMINEYLAFQLGFQTPQDAVGQNIKIRLGQGEYPAEVVGVVKNHHQVSLKENYEPIAYYYPREGWCSFFSVRIKPAGLTQNINAIKDIYSDAFPGNAFEYFFLDDHFNNQYKSDQQFGTIFGIFTALAIVIGCLGLLGLGLFAVTQRTKEIGIRKVLGASAPSILMLFSKDSALLVIVSYIISIPLIYLGTQNWLNNFAFHIGLGWQMFVLPPLLLLAISVASIVFVSLRAALMNPVISLRHE